jgi:hypothetical protein
MSRWAAHNYAIPSGEKLEIYEGSMQLSFREFFASMESESDFARWYSELLARCPFEAFFWELPPLTTESVEHGAEFVIIDSAALSGLRSDATPFQAHFSAHPGSDVIQFRNLGGDALLIVPAPLAPSDSYPHLAAFLRGAPERQKISLWRVAARAVRENLGPVPRWLSTAGLGVSWLHLRLDTRPKYYNFAPYAEAN